MKSKYRSYVRAGGVVRVTQQDKSNPVFYVWKAKHNLKYTGLNVNMIKVFLSQINTKSNRKTCSYIHIRKYHDKILLGLEKPKQPLPPDYIQEMPKFLDSFKKETRKAK